MVKSRRIIRKRVRLLEFSGSENVCNNCGVQSKWSLAFGFGCLVEQTTRLSLNYNQQLWTRRLPIFSIRMVKFVPGIARLAFWTRIDPLHIVWST